MQNLLSANLFRHAATANGAMDAETPARNAGPQTLETPDSEKIVAAFVHEKEDSAVAERIATRNSRRTAKVPASRAEKYSERETPKANAAAAVPVSSSLPTARTTAGTA